MTKKREVKFFEFRKQELKALEQEGKKYIIGRIFYNQLSEDLGGYKEILSPGCFTKTINENRIYALINHNTDKCLGNSKSGTLTFIDTPNYLECRVEINERVSFANDLYEAVLRNDVIGLSFGFSSIKEDWDNTNNIRILKEVRLYEVSFGVVFPAYQSTFSFTETRGFLSLMDKEEKLEVLKELQKELKDLLKEKENEEKKEEERSEDPETNNEKQEINNEPLQQDTTDNNTTVSEDTTQSENKVSSIELYSYKLKILKNL